MKYQFRTVVALIAASALHGCSSFDEAATQGNGGLPAGSGGGLGGSSGGSTGAPKGGSTGAPKGGSTGAPKGGSTGAPKGGSTGAPAGGAGGSAGGSTGSSTGGATGSPTGGSTGSPTGGATGSLTGGSTGSPMGGSTGGSTGSSTGAPAGGAGGSTAVLFNEGAIRMIVSSDIGGSDNDDYQSMAHLAVYADQFQLEGLVSSPAGDGQARHYQVALDAYEKDYPTLKTYSDKYPTPEMMRALVKQGALDKIPSPGYGEPSEGSKWIIERAHDPDPRLLWISVWGAIDDVGQAIHDDPTIKQKIRVYWIGGPNKKHSDATYPYVEKNHKDLWIIENNTTYRGMFNGGNMSGDLSNSTFPAQHIKGHGALGKYYMDYRSDIKMGDTPAVMYFLKAGHNVPEDPTQPGWGGQFVPRAGLPNWWTDDTASSAQEGTYSGAKHINKWREEFLRDYQKMSDRAQSPKQ